MDKIISKNDKYQIAILIIVVLFILLVVFALVFRHVDLGNKNKNSIGDVLTDGDLSINYVDGQDINIKDGKEHEYNISITNLSEKKIYYSIFLSDLNKNIADVSIEDEDHKIINKLEEDLDEKKIINLHAIQGGETLRFLVKVKTSEDGHFKGKLMVVNESLSYDSFADLLLTTYEVGVAKTRIGSEVSTVNEGLLVTEDNKGKTYFFRGSIDYNYVKLNDLMFRIVRINGDGSVRIVLDDVLSEQAPYNVNPSSETASPAALSSLKHASVTNKLNEWLNKNLSEYSRYIVNSDFCTDISFNNYINNNQYSNSYNRIFVDNTPDLYCSGDIYSGKVGLLSADEIVLAGAYRDVSNDKYYLFNSNIKNGYVTSSSYSFNGSEFHMISVTKNGAFGGSVLGSENTYLRPVISIGANAKIKGTGRIDNPYIIVA